MREITWGTRPAGGDVMNARRMLHVFSIGLLVACGAELPPSDLKGQRPTNDTPASPDHEPSSETVTPSAPSSNEPVPSQTSETTEPTAPAEPAEPTPSPLAQRVATAIAYGESVIGTPYGWWYGGALPTGAPMWTASGPAPKTSTVKATSTNCAGLTNLMLRAVGKPLPSDPVAGTGGTGAYGKYYAGVAKKFDANAKYPAGTLIGRYYRDTVDQGHVAVVLADGKVLQSFANAYGASSPGVNATYTVAQSHAGYFYEYAILPQDWLGP